MQKVQPIVGATLLILAAQVPSAQVPVFGDVRVMVPTDADDSRAVVLGDLDADGDPDAVVANAGGQNRLLLNDGVGVFLDATELFPADADDTRDAAIGDVDGDGDFDVLFANAYQQNRLYLNDGTGAFADASGQLPADTDATTALALGDVDGDGDLDLLLGNGGYSGQQTRLYLNDGLGAFSDATGQLPIDAGPTDSVALADVDGDGDLDALIGEGAFPGSIMVGEPNRLYVNGGSGVFTDGTGQLPVDADWTSSIAVGDVDGDGDLDLLLGSNDLFTGINLQNRLYLNGGGGLFTDATGQLPIDSDSTRAVELGDVDGDGDLDALIGNYQQNRLYLNDGSGVFADASGQLPSDFESTAALTLGDVDGDTDLDAVLGNDYFRQNQLYLNDGAGAFTDVTGQLDPAPPNYTPAVAVGDVDGDGDADVLIADYADQNKLLLNDGTGVLTDATGQLPPDSDSTHAVALGDVDGDGSLDAILPSYGSFDPTLLYLNTGAGVFIDATVLLPPNADQSRDAGMGDVDGDGDLDVLIGNGGANRLYLNNGLGAFTDASSQLPPHADFTEAVVLGDVDGDGDLDVFVANSSSSQQNRLYVNDGSGVFGDATGQLPALLDPTSDADLGDVDGDGDLDVLIGNTGTNGLLLNDGTGVFSDASGQLPGLDDNTRAVALGDVDGDGDVDAVIGNDGRNRVYLNDGSGTFADEPDGISDEAVFSDDVALADFDFDGDLDLVVGNGYGARNRLYVNLTRQLARRGEPRIGKTLNMDMYGAPSGPWFLAFAFGPASIPFPPFGTLLLDPASLSLASSGGLDGMGFDSAVFAVPANPALVGTDVHWQSLLGTPLASSNREVTTFSDL